QQPGSLSDRQSDPRPVLDGVLEYRTGPSEAVARIEQAVDLRPVPRPLLNFVEVAVVGIGWAVRLLVEVNVVGLRIGHGPIIDPTEPLLRGSLVRFPKAGRDDLRDQGGRPPT